MRRIDFYVQTFLIVIALIVVLLAIYQHEYPYTILTIQMFLGPWQFGSAVSYVGRRTSFKRARLTHVMISILYLCFMALMFKPNFAEHKQIGILLLTIPAWILAFLYYSITWRTNFPKHKKVSSFLPHLNF